MRKIIAVILTLQLRKLSHGEVSLAQVVEPGFKAKVSSSYNHALLPLEERLHEEQLLNLAFFASEHLSRLYRR